MPEIACYCETGRVTTTKDIEKFFYRVHGQAIKEGYRLLGTEHMFAISEGNWQSLPADPTAPHELTACIPVIAPAANDPKIKVFPASKGFSALAYGDSPIVYDLCVRFWKEISARGIKPAGQVRFIGLSVPFVSKNISPDDFCFRMAVPV